jgi:glutaredoxin-like protein NrdH
MTINVFTKDNCMPCKMTKRWLEGNKVPFTELEITDYADILKEHGLLSAPVVQVINDNHEETVWCGSFDIEKLKKVCLVA